VDGQLKNKDMALELTPTAKALLAKKGYDPVLGARPLRRTIQREIEDALSEKILYGTLKPGEIVVGDVEGEGEEAHFVFRGEPKPTSVPDVPPIDLAKSGE
jgi:ATP-dependent Clp protease ATP-binding subunit ClpC